VQTAYAKIQNSGDALQCIDVRTPGEYAGVWFSEALNIPLSSLDEKMSQLDSGKEVVVFCQSGKRSEMAAEKLEKAGFTEVTVVSGGMEAWLLAGLPSEKGNGVMSLERQVRVVAGLLVAVGTMLGCLVNTGFYGVPAFVGCGLIFAGLTDTCAMGVLLSKMPWNQGGSCST